MVSRKVSVSFVIAGYLAGLVMGVFVGFGLYKTFVPVEVPEQPMPLLEQEFSGAVPEAPNGAVLTNAPAEGERIDANLLKLRLFRGHPLTIIEHGKKIKTPEADSYYGESSTYVTDQREITLEELIEQGKLTNKEYMLLSFGSALCPFCGSIYPYYRELISQYGDRIQIVTIYDAPQSLEDVKEKLNLLKENKTGKPTQEDFNTLNFVVAEQDVIMQFSEDLLLDRIPQIFLIDDSGEILYRSQEEDMAEIFKAIHESDNPIPANDRLCEILEIH